jgi:hypothetical protein
MGLAWWLRQTNVAQNGSLERRRQPSTSLRNDTNKSAMIFSQLMGVVVFRCKLCARFAGRHDFLFWLPFERRSDRRPPGRLPAHDRLAISNEYFVA